MGARARRAAATVVAGCCLLVLAPAALAAAQTSRQAPSPEELWQQYPLERSPHADADGTAVPATSQPAGPTPIRASSTTRASDGAPPIPLLAVVAAVLALAAATVVRARRRPREDDGRREHRWLAAALRSPALAAASGPGFDEPMRMSGGPGEGGPPRLWRTHRHEARAPEGAPPPDTGRAWTAEVQWEHAEGKGRFRVLASSDDGGAAVVIAESEPLEWPPRGPASVQAMSRAADELESSLLAAGWKPLAPGEAWYSKRFAWQRVVARAAPAAAEPVAAEEADPKRRRRFARRVPWPEEAEELWRCELEWRPGYVNSRFEAIVSPPGHKRGQPIGGSATFKWLLMGDPDATAPEYRREIDRLTGTLEAAGWERIADGTNWFSRRFVWRRDPPPPERLEAGPAGTRNAAN